MKNKNDNSYTAYIVVDAGTRSVLRTRSYANSTSLYSRDVGEAHIFYKRTAAQSCASNINSRGGRRDRLHLQVTPITLYRRRTR